MKSERRLSVAPMVGVTDMPFRLLLGILAPSVTRFTEMVRPETVATREAEVTLARAPVPGHEVAQLSGRDPQRLADGVRQACELGFEEVNLNLGCPGRTMAAQGCGVAMLREPERVVRCVEAMVAAAPVEVTVKTRLGIQGEVGSQDVRELLGRLADTGCRAVYLHARDAALDPSWNSRMNREIPPLRRSELRHVGQGLGLDVIANGGLRGVADVRAAWSESMGAMLGRVVQRDPFRIREISRTLQDPTLDVGGSAIVDVASRYLRAVEGVVDWEAASGPLERLLAPSTQRLSRAGFRAWRSPHDAREALLPMRNHSSAWGSPCPG